MAGTMERGAFGRALDALYLFAGYLAGAFLVLIFVLMMVLSVGRNPWLPVNVPAGDDFAAWSMAAMSFLGLAHTFKRGEMIRVGLLLERLSGRAKWLAEMITLTIATGFIAFFAFYACQMARDSWRFNDMAQGVVAVPLWIPQSGFAVGVTILLIALIDEWVHVAGGNKPRYEKDPPATPEELVARVAEGGGV